jgi:sulfur carrier protein
MQLIVNGEHMETQAATVAALISELGHEGYVAVAVNEEIVSRRNWAQTRLADGDALEVITPRQGG